MLSITYLGPFAAALLSGAAIFYLFQMMKKSDQLTAQKLKSSDKAK
jgi:hypothetical protein